MKNLLIVIVAIAVFLHFNPQPEVSKFYDQQKAVLLDAFAEFSDTKVRLKSDKILSDLQPKLANFSTPEVDYLKEITSSRSKVKDFYQNYCKVDAASITFHPANQATVCDAISHYASML